MRLCITLALVLMGVGCCHCVPPAPPAPLPQSPALGWKIGTLTSGCQVVKVDTHYEMKCPMDKPGDPPVICWVQEGALRCKRDTTNSGQ